MRYYKDSIANTENSYLAIAVNYITIFIKFRASMQEQTKTVVTDVRILRSIFVDSAGNPRFEIPIPSDFMKDAGVAFLIKHETEYGGYEFPTRKFLDAHLMPGDVFVDVGAHWGIFTLTAATRWLGQIRVWALEPHPVNVEMLNRAIQHNHLSNIVTVLPIAAGEMTSVLPLTLNSTMGHSLVNQGSSFVDVAVEPLDSLLRELPSSGRIFLKIDAEGFEPQVLRGARNLLKDCRVVAVIWEKGTYFDMEPGLTGLRDSLELLDEYGFTHLRFPDENAGGSLKKFVLNNERCNIFSLRGLDPLPCYEKPPGMNAPPVPTGPINVASPASSITQETQRRLDAIAAKQTDIVRWSDPRQLEASWEKHAEFASQAIPAGTRVLDIGCGAMTLEKHLPERCSYQPCDVVARDERTIVCDLNQSELPDEYVLNSDIVTLLGVIEYLSHPEKVFHQLARLGKAVLVSYCVSDYLSDTNHRRSLGWVNDLSIEAFLFMVKSAGFSVCRSGKIDALQILFSLKPQQEVVVVQKPKRVLVLTYNNVGNFGDRLGYHLANSVLPPNAEVTYANFRPWSVPNSEFDLLILGIGNSLFAPLLTDQLLALIDRIPKKIGIFGTQYRNDFKTEQMQAVINRLDCWFARYREDINIYGRGCNNVFHLGDWLIDAFPLAKAESDDVLNIGQEIWNNLPLDRTIQKIQQHKKVFSTRLHPLLCALTSAEVVAYREQRENQSGDKSGKFRSMLIDIFNKDFPEDTFWVVDRDAVLSYKTAVSANIKYLEQYIKNALAQA